MNNKDTKDTKNIKSKQEFGIVKQSKNRRGKQTDEERRNWKNERFCKGIWKKCDQRRRGKRMLLRKKEKNKRGVTKEEVNFSER